MKKLLTTLIVLLMLSSALTACDNAPVSSSLMADASPATSAMALYYYDGKTVTQSYIFHTPTAQTLLDELDTVKAVKAGDWTPDDITLPVYGLNIGKTDGFGIFVAWSNGYWITQTGDAYKFDIDFAELFEKYPGTDTREFDSFTVFPNAYYLTQDKNGWRNTLLTPAAELSPPENVTMTLESWNPDKVTVSFANTGSAEWMYGEYFSLEAQLGGVWYEIPATPNNWGFNDIGYILSAGQSRSMEYPLTMYGALPAGMYRLVAFGLTVEYTMS